MCVFVCVRVLTANKKDVSINKTLLGSSKFIIHKEMVAGVAIGRGGYWWGGGLVLRLPRPREFM